MPPRQWSYVPPDRPRCPLAGRLRRTPLSRAPLLMIVRRLDGDAVQPRGRRSASPFISAEIRERLMEHVRRDVLRLRPIAHTTCNERVDAIEVHVVQIGEACR